MDNIGLLVDIIDRLVICKKIKILKWLFRLVELMAAMSKELVPWNLILHMVHAALINLKWRKYFSAFIILLLKNVICKFALLACRLKFIFNSDLMENLSRLQNQLRLNTNILTTWQNISGNRSQLVALVLMPRLK